MGAFVPRPVEIVLLPELIEQMVGPKSKGVTGASIEELDRWRAWAYNNETRNVVIAGDSTTETGQRLGLAIVQEIETRFGVTQCKKLRRAKRDYDVGEKTLP